MDAASPLHINYCQGRGWKGESTIVQLLLRGKAQLTHDTQRCWCLVQVLLTSLPDAGYSSTQVLVSPGVAPFSTVQQLRDVPTEQSHFSILFFSCFARVGDEKWCFFDVQKVLVILCSGLESPFADNPELQGFQKWHFQSHRNYRNAERKWHVWFPKLETCEEGKVSSKLLSLAAFASWIVTHLVWERLFPTEHAKTLLSVNNKSLLIALTFWRSWCRCTALPSHKCWLHWDSCIMKSK